MHDPLEIERATNSCTTDAEAIQSGGKESHSNPPATKPNIVLVIADQFRYDGIQDHGSEYLSTPTLDQWVREGYDFHNAYSVTPTCIPARASLLSGLTQKTTGIVGYTEEAHWNFPQMMGKVFSERGYYTKGIGKFHTNPPKKLFGFHHIELHDGYLHARRNLGLPVKESYAYTDDYLAWLQEQPVNVHDIIQMGLECNSWVAQPWTYPEYLHPTNWATSRAIDFLRAKDPTMPFLLVLSYVRPHSPLDPPQAYYDRYQQRLPEDIHPVLSDWEKDRVRQPMSRVDGLTGQLSPSDYRDMLAGYYGAITHLDHQLNRFMMHLLESGEYENTIIVFTSDHGDQLGDHGLFRKAFPYQESIHIPLVIYDPGHLLGDRSQQITAINDFVELADILPTLVDIATGETLPDVDGQSVLPLIKGDSQIAWRDYLHGEHVLGEWSNQFIIDKQYKYIWFTQTGQEQLFNIQEDPTELNDLSEDPAMSEVLSALKERLIQALTDRPEGFVQDGTLVAGCKQSALLPINEAYHEA